MDPSFLPAWRMAELTRGGQLGCVELLDHCLARVERLDGALNAVVARDFERARARARRLDRAPREGALFGVPMTVKESFDLAGLPTTWGLPDRREHRAEVDALPVRRLEAAGAVVFGKTNVPVMLADWQSDNPVYGRSNNPWNPDRTPGGSSGGSAAALAAGFSGLELGSDIGGSIRVPAHFCGVFGHKPTWGLCPPRGQGLATLAGMTDIAVIGPLARSARDLILGLDAIAGPDPEETDLVVALPPPRMQGMGGLRVAVWASEPGQATDPAQSALIEAAAARMAAAGAIVSHTARPAFDPVAAFHLYITLLDAALSARTPEDVLAQRRAARDKLAADDTSPSATFLRAVDLPHSRWLQLNERRHQIKRLWSAFFRDWDVLLCPAFASTAYPHMNDDTPWERKVMVGNTPADYDSLLFWPGLTCAFHLPASVAPLGLVGGLPVGVQIVGPVYGDRTTLAVAEWLEANWRGFEPPTGYA